MLIDKVNQHATFYLYGAQVVAYGAYRAIKHLTGQIPQGFVVSNAQDQPKQIEGIPVITPENLHWDAFVIVAVTELLQETVVKSLHQRGIRDFFLLTAHEEHLLMEAYFDSLGLFPAAKIFKNTMPSDFAMYEVCNYRDKPLSSPPTRKTFEHTLQAGAALTDSRIAEFTDDTGQNISAKNPQYCEMSAVYWIWKNQWHDWVGIEHYRRHLLVTPDMLTDNVDAILPLPYICYPDTLSQFRRFVSEDVLRALLVALQELHPGEYNRYLSILQGQYQYTYNLLCAQWEVFDDYCAWFFRITEYLESMGDKVSDIKNTRALSYVAEVLTNLYFMSHRQWRVKHVEKAIFV
ncbi:MAG: DUF4422 domain-containing protein [Selenomonadaceae bacterium]|nr:DUF4422 domain-containing protein [Selenomonadaceae bacterium]